MNSRTKTILPRIGLIVFPMRNPFEECGQMFTSELINVLAPISSRLCIITGNYFPNDIPDNVRIINIKSPIIKTHDESIISKVHRLLTTQFRISIKLIRLSKEIDIVILFFGASFIWLPTVIACIQRKKIVIVVAGSGSQSIERMYPGVLGRFFSLIFRLIENINFHLADQVAVESESSIGFLGLNKYRKNISVTGTVFVDTDNFKITKELKNRKNLIGYIGRLSSEKGVLNFAKAIPLILKEKNDLDFLIGGGGSLFEEIKNELKNNGSYNKVELTGWIPHDELPKYLNELKLIIAPSYTEGGIPGVIMEAMACGTVSLVTPVAGVDIIKDGENGFILDDNSPECIAKNVIRALEHPNLDKIVKNARNLVEEEFSYETEVRRYRDMLYGLLYNKE